MLRTAGSPFHLESYDGSALAAERNPGKRRGSEAGKLKKGNVAPFDSTTLTEDQAALRYTALLVVIQMIESLEPLLKEVSGKNQEEWQRWW